MNHREVYEAADLVAPGRAEIGRGTATDSDDLLSPGAPFAVDAPRRPHPADPEFDPSPGSAVRLRDFDPLEHQRLVVNPFLAVLGLIGLWQTTLWLFHFSFLLLAVAMVIPLAFLPFLIQYHCLDCGRTGLYSRRRRHACPSVLARWNERHSSRLPFPSSRAQLVFWGWFLGSIAVLLAVAASN